MIEWSLPEAKLSCDLGCGFGCWMSVCVGMVGMVVKS